MSSSKTEKFAGEISNKLGFYTSLIITILTVITFLIAFFTPPLSGPYCLSGCFEYPYTDIISRYPRDYYWMFPAMLLNILLIIFVICIQHFADAEKKIFGQIGSAFAIVSSVILISNYFLQISVIQPSLIKGETDGIALLTQFNPHGVFIALEDIGYIMMSIALFSLTPIFSKKERIEKSIRWLFILGFVLMILSLTLYSTIYGIYREYRFEVAIISINWIVLIISGILMSILFNRARKKQKV